jgi:hypothetical protein
MLTDPALEAAVLCTHDELIGEVLEDAGEAGLRLLGPRRKEKGSFWIVESGGGSLPEARYIGPAQSPATCSKR